MGTTSSNNISVNEEFSVGDLENFGIIANSPISKPEIESARKIITEVYKKTSEGVKRGKGPFFAIVCDERSNIVAEASNSVVEDGCSLNHAEMNVLRKVHEKFGKYDLSCENLSIYINAEPCIMCAGAIMWSGIKNVYFGVPSCEVEAITGFDEGFKPGWICEFKKRGIRVFGNIEPEAGKAVLSDYVNKGNIVYKPTRE